MPNLLKERNPTAYRWITEGEEIDEYFDCWMTSEVPAVDEAGVLIVVSQWMNDGGKTVELIERYSVDGVLSTEVSFEM
jgi:hypothetical protein